MSEIDTKLHMLQGQILGLQVILRAILEDNPDIHIDEHKIGRFIKDADADHSDIQSQARGMMHLIISGRDTR